MYQTIKLSRLVELVPFITPVALEKVVVKTAHSSGIQVSECVYMCGLEVTNDGFSLVRLKSNELLVL